MDFNTIYLGMYYSCKNGHKNMIEKEANNFEDGLICACKGGNLELVELMLQNGANDFRRGFSEACDAGNKNVAEFILQKVEINDGINYEFYKSCENGHRDIVELLIMDL